MELLTVELFFAKRLIRSIRRAIILTIIIILIIKLIFKLIIPSTLHPAGDEPIDLSKRKCPSSRLNSVVSLLEQESFADNPQLLKNISIDALNTLSNQNSTDAQMAAAAFLLPKALTTLNAQQLQQLMLKQQSRIYSCNNCQIEFHKQENYVVHKKFYCSATKQQQALLDAAGSSLNSLNSFSNSLSHNLNQINSLNSLNSLNTQKQSPSTSIDDLDTANQLLNSAPNSPQSIHSQTGQSANRTSVASSSAAAVATMNLVDTLVSQAAAVANKKSSSSSSLANNSNSKTSGCVSPSISNSPVGSPPSFNQLAGAAQPSANPVQPIYKHFCSKCGIRFTSKDNLHAHQTYYCGNNSTTGLNGAGLTITNFNSASGLIEVNCPKCKCSISESENSFSLQSLRDPLCFCLYPLSATTHTNPLLSLLSAPAQVLQATAVRKRFWRTSARRTCPPLVKYPP